MFPLDAENKTMVTSTNRLIDKVKEVIQFESGVFIAIRKDKKINWETDFLPVTEEDEGLQHPFADIEIRAFDYSYFEISGMDFEVEKKILKHLE
ncbi:hypothetical protein [Halalkalibacterium halodurans]|nr:hypothetical protein [Halalkalibacterium halodurans]TPE68201.1 hypothetical protein AMD02_014635 [Halalkalibacterium halodurans]